METNIENSITAPTDNNIYKRYFYVLCGCILFDLIIRFNLWNFSDGSFLIANGIEIVFLITLLTVNIFALAKKGIFRNNILSTDSKFPKLHCFLTSLSIAAIIAISAFTIRGIIYFISGGAASSPNIGAEFMIIAMLMLLLFAVIFVFCFLILYLSFRTAKRNCNRE